jgi:hypothetical protein
MRSREWARLQRDCACHARGVASIDGATRRLTAAVEEVPMCHDFDPALARARALAALRRKTPVTEAPVAPAAPAPSAQPPGPQAPATTPETEPA